MLDEQTAREPSIRRQTSGRHYAGPNEDQDTSNSCQHGTGVWGLDAHRRITLSVPKQNEG
eukprot:8810579-Prorocentrum_lima.AAC.1